MSPSGSDIAGHTAAPTLDRAALDRALIDAHAAEDLTRLVTLYAEAADRSEAAADIDAACFFLTQAYVFALAAGDRRAGPLNARLASHGRDLAQPDLGPA